MKWFGLILGITSIYRTSASEAILANRTKSASWISEGKLTRLLKASFETSPCCNVMISGNAVAVETVLNEFVRIYPYAWTLNNRTYGCPNYFLISTSVVHLVNLMTKVPTTTASARVLIVLVGDNVEESSGAFNVSMYQTANVNIATRNGFWTLSENYVNPRVFKRVFGFRGMAYNNQRRFVDFQGRELRAVTVFRPPYSYLRTTVNRSDNGIAAEFYTADDQSELDGIEIQLFRLMARRLNFTWTIRQGDLINRYGVRNGSSWSGGMIGQVFDKEVDIAFSAMFLELGSHELTNLTQPWTQSASKFAVPKPKPHRSFYALVTPLSKEVWTAILVLLILQSVYLFGRAWIDPRISRRFRNFVVTITELMGQLLGVWMPARMQGLKVQLCLWHLVGILLVTAYCTNLAARLARQLYDNKIDTIRQLAESNLTWSSLDTIHFEIYFDATDSNAYEFWKRVEYDANEDVTRRKILAGNYAIFGEVIDTVFFPRNDVNDRDFKGYRIMKDATDSHYVVFTVQPWLIGPLNVVMVQLRETGVVQYQIDSVVQRHVGSAQRDLMVDQDDNEGPKVLTLTSLGVAFCILVLGFIISTIVFFLELIYFNRKRSPLEVLEQIKKNREAWRIKELRRKRGYPFFG